MALECLFMKRAFSSATLQAKANEGENSIEIERYSLAPAIWNNGIIIISNQISVTEAKNTHHIKAMTRREMKRRKKDSFRWSSWAVQFRFQRIKKAGCNEVVKRFYAYSLFSLRSSSWHFSWCFFSRTARIIHTHYVCVICFGRFVCNYLFFVYLF